MSLDSIIHRQRPSWFQLLQKAPSTTIAKTLCALRAKSKRQTASHGLGIVVVCISDTHNTQPPLPPGDLLIHVGDLTQNGTAEELQSQLDWIIRQPHRHKVVIAGNHDRILDGTQAGECERKSSFQWGGITYLQDTAANLKFSCGKSLTIYGSPWTRKHGNWAFQYDRGVDKFGGQMDADVDILVTHAAPKYHLDIAGWGEAFLLQELWRVKPALHVFGHLHEGYGRKDLVYDRFEQLYEMVCAGRAGFVALLKMMLLLLTIWATGPDPGVMRTTLINASIVGGLLDEKARQPQVVVL